MKSILIIGAVLALGVSLGGCATHEVAGNGQTVRAIRASQVAPPQPRAPEQGVDAASAVAGYANYQRSYVSPVSQSNASSFDRK